MRSENEITKMLERFDQLTPSYTVHAIRAILKLILELDANEDITFLDQLNRDIETVKRAEEEQ